MNLTATTQATLLLTAHFNKNSDKTIKPLTNGEWGKFALWLMDVELKPESLLTGDPAALLAGWDDKKITKERIETLLNRGSAMALAVEKWSRAGLWILTRSDANYPSRLKKHLKANSPPVLFGCGNQALLNKGGIAVIGSRNTSKEDLQYSKDLGVLSAQKGYSIVSGGARGVDEESMMGALNTDGTVIGVLANSLLQACTSHKYRKALMNNNLVLVSAFYPEAGFNVGNAMQRNKYIYCLADTSIAVHSGTKGGTWTGVLENLKKNWVPMWVKQTKDEQSGNAQLVKKGAAWISDDLSEVDFEAIFKMQPTQTVDENTDLFSMPAEQETKAEIKQQDKEKPTVTEEKIEVKEEALAEQKQESDNKKEITENEPPQISEKSEKPEIVNNEVDDNALTFYLFFLKKIESLCTDTTQTVDQLQEATELNKAQLNIWLKQAVDDGKVIKNKSPVSYQWNKAQQEQLF
ncbi:MAG: DNA-protecting protein DprA [Gammaproteobacteria bacterium]|jgi:predicted Rossmann fold nucleotide-binding protein DprA/Smf involved in DNA uptake|nr:DNA-protecting protein DprA [Gammaproteobacteria bacterium]MBT4449491.1 DNA-protecting protein DprA [Gammaproteobacteria bacterium]MBT7209300.1 DNA-protecting protein DprA [Gammaproteobacteria bacterium]